MKIGLEQEATPTDELVDCSLGVAQVGREQHFAAEYVVELECPARKKDLVHAMGFAQAEAVGLRY